MSTTTDATEAAAPEKDQLLEPKPQPKVIRALTVMAYLLSVSMAAILLSVYYIFMWEGKPHLGARTSVQVALPQSLVQLRRIENTTNEKEDRGDGSMSYIILDDEMQQQVTTPLIDESLELRHLTDSATDETYTVAGDYDNNSSEMEALEDFSTNRKNNILIKKLFYYRKIPYLTND